MACHGCSPQGHAQRAPRVTYYEAKSKLYFGDINSRCTAKSDPFELSPVRMGRLCLTPDHEQCGIYQTAQKLTGFSSKGNTLIEVFAEEAERERKYPHKRDDPTLRSNIIKRD